MSRHKIENGCILIGETDYHAMFAGRSDLQKHGFNMFDIPKHGYDARMALAIEFIKCMLSTASFDEYARIGDIAQATGTPPEDPVKLVERAFTISELVFAKGLDKGWMHSLDEEAMRVLREAQDEGKFQGFSSGKE